MPVRERDDNHKISGKIKALKEKRRKKKEEALLCGGFRLFREKFQTSLNELQTTQPVIEWTSFIAHRSWIMELNDDSGLPPLSTGSCSGSILLIAKRAIVF